VTTRDETLRRLGALLRAYDRHSRAVGGPAASEARLDAEFNRLATSLERDWADRLDRFLTSARAALAASPGAGLGTLEETAAALRQEAALLSDLKAGLARLERFHAAYPGAAASEPSLATTGELLAFLRSLHAAAKRQVADSRPLRRKPKKSRKRQVAKGTVSLVIGTACFVANANLPTLMAWSYAAGFGALHQALRDLIGERRDASAEAGEAVADPGEPGADPGDAAVDPGGPATGPPNPELCRRN